MTFSRRGTRAFMVAYALLAVLILILGTPLADWLAQGEFPGKRVIDTLVDLPLVLPPAVAQLKSLMKSAS